MSDALKIAVLPRPKPNDSITRAAVLAWLVGRGDLPSSIQLAPWQAKREHYHTAPAGPPTDPLSEPRFGRPPG